MKRTIGVVMKQGVALVAFFAVPVTLTLMLIWLAGCEGDPPEDAAVTVPVVRLFQGEELVMTIPLNVWEAHSVILSDSSVVTVERVGANIVTGEGRITAPWVVVRAMARDTVFASVPKSMLAAVQ